jgi:hypothetical protein
MVGTEGIAGRFCCTLWKRSVVRRFRREKDSMMVVLGQRAWVDGIRTKLVLKLLIYNAIGLNDCDDAGRKNGRSLVSSGVS